MNLNETLRALRQDHGLLLKEPCGNHTVGTQPSEQAGYSINQADRFE